MRNKDNLSVKIVATIGSATVIGDNMENVLKVADCARLNFSHGDHTQKSQFIGQIVDFEKKFGKHIEVIADLSGPRTQEGREHHFNNSSPETITEKDLNDLKFCLATKVDKIAQSFVGGAGDIIKLREYMQSFGKVIPIIAKIERKVALENLDEIISETDEVMVARGDLGNEIEIEKIPYEEKIIVDKCNAAGKPVIVATQMMLSMTNSPTPTRAEVTDVAYAVQIGADGVMLSEESASGKYPVEAVTEMRKIVDEVIREMHTPGCF
jgi:pyruvate kinase